MPSVTPEDVLRLKKPTDGELQREISVLLLWQDMHSATDLLMSKVFS